MAESRFYGGQAVLEGVMMRGRDLYATAVRRRDGSVVVEHRPVPHLFERSKWAQLPLLRGSVMLVETLTLGLRSLQFSANVALQDEMRSQERESPAEAEAARPAPKATRRPWATAAVALVATVLVIRLVPKLAPFVAQQLPWFDTPDEAVLPMRVAVGVLGIALVLVLVRGPRKSVSKGPETLSDSAMWMAFLPALAIGMGLFVLLPSSLAGFVKLEASYGSAVLKNVIEGVIRLALILGYIAGVGLIPDIRRVFQYHGAEHKVINTLERDGAVDREGALSHSPLHPRCGTAFLLMFIVLKIIIGCFFGWPVWYWRLALRLAMVPVVAAIAYELTRLAGKYRDSSIVRAVSGPGLLLQRLTTREPVPEMVEVAMYALASVAPEVELPADWPPPQEFVLQTEEAGEPSAQGGVG